MMSFERPSRRARRASVFATLSFVATGAVFAQPAGFPLCRDLAFSTEEDFVTNGPKPADGNVIVSDGDLLTRSGSGAAVCARNADLLRVFEVRVDLGLDAADVVDSEKRLIAFSTELDDPKRGFTAGDLLATNGAVIPNAALMVLFNLPVPEDIGLDAVHFVGTTQAIVDVLERVRAAGRAQLIDDPRLLIEILEGLEVDIWFSTEGTGPTPSGPKFLDGDLLSARSGSIVVPNSTLLPSSVPAGIPNRGIDFGLDAVTADRNGNKERILFSTEILFRRRPLFTDGDILRFGNGIVLTNEDLIKAFEPAADFLGLDALSLRRPEQQRDEPFITHIGQFPVSDINGGAVAIGGPGSGLATVGSYERPFGRWVPIHGHIPAAVHEFRVAYRVAGTPRPAVAAGASGISVVPATGWVADQFAVIDCSGSFPYSSDASGWFNGSDYRRLEQGEGVPFNVACNPQLALTVWNSNVSATLDTEGHYVVWLQWRDTPAGPIQEEPFDHHVQFDNKPPQIGGLGIPGGACAQYGPSDMPIMVQAEFDDAHFLSYRLRIFGGSPPAAKNYPSVTFDASATDNVGGMGTLGVGLQDLHPVNVNDLPATSVVECAYGIRLRLADRTIIGGFIPPSNTLPMSFGFSAIQEITFDYTP